MADEELHSAQIRPTGQRLALLQLIRDSGRVHFQAEQLYREAQKAGLRLSLATVYNTLKVFAQGGLLRRVDLGDRAWFCTNRDPHHHLYDETLGELSDIPAAALELHGLPNLPEDAQSIRCDVVIRFRRSGKGNTRF